MIDLLAALDSLSESIEASSPEASQLIDEAGILLMASDVRISAYVDDLAGLLRSQLPSMSYEDSIQVATDLVQRFSNDPSTGERDALNPITLTVLAPQLPHTTFKQGPDPASSGLYAPGKPDWWNVK